MVLQHKAKTNLHDLIESQARSTMPEVVIQAKPLTSLFAQTSQPDPVDNKRKWDKKGKDVVDEEEQVIPSKEHEPQKGVKIARIT